MEQQIGVLFEAHQFDDVYDATSKQFQQFITRSKFQELCKQFMTGTKTLTLTYDNPFLQMHNYVWIDDKKENALFVTFDAAGIIQGLYMKPFVAYREQNKKYTKNTFHMPVLDEWYVFWGGDNEFQNYHYPYENQRFAYDLVKMKNYQTFDTHQHLYTSYYAYNEQVVAPCAGTVISVVNNIADNEIGQTNEDQPAGNYVIIEHAFHEYSFIAHFKKGSIIVKPGDKVELGQPLGTCGNSGNSSEPHIHFHVMDSPDYETATSIRIRFAKGFEPVQGGVVNQIVPTKERLDLFEKGEIASATLDVLTLIQRAMGGFFR